MLTSAHLVLVGSPQFCVTRSQSRTITDRSGGSARSTGGDERSRTVCFNESSQPNKANNKKMRIQCPRQGALPHPRGSSKRLRTADGGDLVADRAEAGAAHLHTVALASLGRPAGTSQADGVDPIAA